MVTGRALALAALWLPLALAAPAPAQPYPNKPITLVIPLPPGGSNDIMARAVADKMSIALGQQIIIENRASGGSGTVATRAVARGAADGYTILLGYTSTLATGAEPDPQRRLRCPQGFRAAGADRVRAGTVAGAPEHAGARRRRPDRADEEFAASRSRSARRASARSTISHPSCLRMQAGVKVSRFPTPAPIRSTPT